MTKSASSQPSSKEAIVVNTSALMINGDNEAGEPERVDPSAVSAAAASSALILSNESSSSCRHNPPLADVVTNDTRRLVDCEQFKLETLQNLFKFKNESLFTDVSIYVDGIEFACHKVVLCAASTYFKAMFTCDLKESRLGKVYIESISPWTMKRLIDFIYTGKIEINYENVIDLFNAALMFQLTVLVDKCTCYIQEHIEVSNCVEVHIFASIHNLTELERDTFAFILDNFMLLLNSNNNNINEPPEPPEPDDSSGQPTSLVNMSDFVHLNEATFAALLKSDSLNVSREIYAYYALKKWTEHRESDHDAQVVKSVKVKSPSPAGHTCRMQPVYENLFKYIRLNSLSKEELEYVLANDQYVQASQALSSKLRHLLHVKYSKGDRPDLNEEPVVKVTSAVEVSPKLPSDDHLLKIKNSMERNTRPSTIPREYLCLLQGDTFQLYDFYKSKWETLTSWPLVVNYSSASSQTSTHLSAAADEQGPRPRCKLNGFSTCLVNNVLYVTGGYLVDSLATSSSSEPLIELVDCVWRFDPVKSEWSACKPMLRKRAFHLSISLMSTTAAGHSASSKDYLFLFYGVCYEGGKGATTTTPVSDAFNYSLATCLTIEFYDIESDAWSVLNLNKSLLSQHLFQSVHLNSSRSYRTQTAAVAAASAALNSNLVQNNQPNEAADPSEENAGNQAEDNRLLLLNNLLDHQRNLVRSIVSLRNLVYILKENCIHCYEFNSTLGQLTCLPYFCLPSNLATFHLATAVPVKTSSSACMSVFTWLSDDDDDTINEDGSSSAQFTRYSRKAQEAPNTDNDSADEHAVCKKEALVYLINPQQRSVYEFYPAKNKLKQMPSLALAHSAKDTFILDINSKLYATGGILAAAASSSSSSFDDSPSATAISTPTAHTGSRAPGQAEAQESPAGLAIESYNKEAHTWSIFMGANSSAPVDSESSLLPVQRHFFKLKTSFV